MGLISSIKKSVVGMVGNYAKEYLTVDNIQDWIIDAVNKLLAKAMQNVDAEKLEKICKTMGDVSALCGTLSKALADKKISPEEAAQIISDIQTIIGNSGITNEKIGELIDKAVAGIKEKI